MANWKKYLIVAVCAGVFLSYMGYFDKPEDRVNEFVGAFNRQDLREMINMLDNDEANKMKSAINITGAISQSLIGGNASELLLDFLPISEEVMGYTGNRMYAEIQSSQIDFLRTEATVNAVVTMKYEDHSTVENLSFKLKKKDRVWYITDIAEYE